MPVRESGPTATKSNRIAPVNYGGTEEDEGKTN